MNFFRSKHILIAIILLQLSCKKLIEIDAPKTSLVTEKIFSTNDQATSAINGIYGDMRTIGYASGTYTGFSMFAGMSADELTNYLGTWAPFYENQLTPQEGIIQTFYSQPYKCIFTTNVILQGLSASAGVTPAVKAQLTGEAYFLRAFNYFYLVNMFGDIPLQLSTDYKINQSLKRLPATQIYQQIISDLTVAESLLLEAYPTNTKIRANKTAVQAMLARTYLYLKDWSNAEKYASLVISKNSYSLVNFDAVFLANSQEAIWQLEPTANTNASDGTTFIPASFIALPSLISLSNNFVLTAFEPNDKRKDNWTRSYKVGSSTFYYPFKYKIRTATTATEFSTVLRLAEQYLIRAEARINQDKIATGISDLNVVRQRTLPSGINANTLVALSDALSKSDALTAVENERRIELFCEWGHRWLDLKRLGKADAVLSTIKTSWQSTDALYPIPQYEINNSPQITQNQGY